jgi:exodeoxyribonuclease-3
MLKIATWNVNGIRARQAQVLELIERDAPDILCLQEIKAAGPQIPEALCRLQGYRCYWHGERAYSGVGLHIREGAFGEPPRFAHPPFDYESRIVTAEVGDVVIASVYVPNGGRDYPAKLRFFEELDRYVAALHDRGRKIVLCGDINVTRSDRDVHPKERNPNAIGQRSEERELFARLLSRGLVDVGRALDPENDGLFTWWAPWRRMRERNIGWRLDYVLVSSPLFGDVSASAVLRDFGTSDHAPVTAALELSG